MNSELFEKELKYSLNEIFDKAKLTHECRYIFVLLGLHSGIENDGWNPTGELRDFYNDIATLINSSSSNLYMNVRLRLVLYCRIYEDNYIYNILYNMLLTIEGNLPKIFAFNSKIRNGKPLSGNPKIFHIKKKLKYLDCIQLLNLMLEIFDDSVRNAVIHSDYIIYNNYVRLKHKNSEIRNICIQDILDLTEKMFIFFNTFFGVLKEHKQDYNHDQILSCGIGQSRIKLIVDDNNYLVGLQGIDPLPLDL